MTPYAGPAYERLQAAGYKLINMGGGLMHWHQTDGEIEQTITLAEFDGGTATDLSDRVNLYTSDGDASEADPANVPLWALLEAIEGCDCYIQHCLRWANRHSADVHDAHCKRWKG